MSERGRSRSDPPQRGNPHELSRRQHVFPVKSIQQFERDGGVELYDLVRGKARRAGARDAMFCADRSWNHGTETGFMKRIEDAFQALAVMILAELPNSFDEAQTDIISDFYALWQARAERRHLPMQYIKPTGTLGVRHHNTPDELEQLEKNGIMATRPDGSFAMRDLMGSVIYLATDRIKEALAAKCWGLIEPLEGEFCVPDLPRHGILPLAPSLALIANSPSGRITRENIANINRAMFGHSQEYLFARDLNACPGLPVGSG